METPNHSYLIVKANKLIEAAYRLTMAEQRLLLAVIAQIDSRPTGDSVHDVNFEVSASQITDLYEIPLKQSYELMRDAAERIAERWVVIQHPDPDTPALAYTRTRWISAIDYLPSEGRIRLYLAPKIVPYLTQLAGEFARYKLKHVSAMTSIYAVRLYELLIQWQMQGEREVPVDWLRERFVVPEQYTRIFDLKRRVVEPAVEQINAHSNLWVRWSQRKVGRVVVAFQFQFGLKANQPVIPAPTGHSVQHALTRSEIERAARPGETWDDVQVRLMRERDKSGKSERSAQGQDNLGGM